MPPRAKTKLPPSTAHSSADAQPGLQQGAQRTRDRILQAARELVLEEGASRLTLDAVVVRAGLSKGAFLYHFKTKRDLFVTLIDEMIRAFDAVQANHERRFAGDPDPGCRARWKRCPTTRCRRWAQRCSRQLRKIQHFRPTARVVPRAVRTRASIPAWHRDRGTHHAGIGWRPVRRSSGFANTRTRRAAAFLSGAPGSRLGPSRTCPGKRTHMSRVRSGVMTACAPRSLAVACTLSISTLLSGCGNSQSTVSEPPRAVKLAAAQSDLPHSSRIELTGSARATERSILGFETGGRIAKLNVDVGERFSRGQVLAELDAQPDRLRVTQAQASLAAAEAGLMDRRVQTDQQRRLLESEVISPAAFESAKAQLAVAEGQARTAKAALGLAERAQRGTMIVAPFDGVVAEKLALAFTDIAAGAPVFQVDGVRSGTEIIANASTTQAPHIDVGQRAELSWSGAEQPIRAVVRRVGLRAENGSLLPVVLVPEDNAQARALRPGIPVQVVLDAPAATSKTSRPETVSIPYASLVLGTKPGEASVFVYTPEDKKVHRRAVRFTPVQEGDSARVLAGLKPGETVVAAGGGWLTDGQPVTPLEATTQLTKR